MNEDAPGRYDRRQFLWRTAVATGLGWGSGRLALAQGRGVALVVDPKDPVASSPPAGWAVGELRDALASRGIDVVLAPRVEDTPPDAACVVVAGAVTDAARGVLEQAALAVPGVDEALGLVPGRMAGRDLLLACGRDPLGLVYAVLELADRVRFHTDPVGSLAVDRGVVESPANRVRCISRAFCSDVEDKPWYDDREMWPEYLGMLVSQRYNRFNLTLGLAYDNTRNVRDCYFHFAYPFLVDVPGYDVRAVPLPDAERDKNMETLRFIAEEAARRGLQFNLGIWTHAYIWTENADPNYLIEGLTPETHGPYCRDALRKILQECPGITGVTIRIHGESGVREGSWEFWKTVFDGVATCGRTVRIDLHAKGITQRMLDMALATGMPVEAAPKYWAEHMGLPYHQAAIRELERRPREGDDFSSISTGSRRFTRYGYGDLMKEDRRYEVLFRMFPGTRRVLLWGDPLTAAGFGRVSHFCGAAGVDYMEPLYFKGRRGSGVPGDRCSYADPSLRTRWDWQKFLYTHRVWGRLLYNPDADPDVWRRYLRARFGEGALPAEEALAAATRLLQIVTTVHGVSAAHNSYWPEMYVNMSIVDPEAPHPYRDTPAPRRFGTVSPFDPEMFLTVDETAAELVHGESSGRYTPIEAAQWLEDLAATAAARLATARQAVPDAEEPEFRRLAIDTTIQIGLGRFFAAKFRSAVLWGLWTEAGERRALEEAVAAYRRARDAWAELAELAWGVYMEDVSYGPQEHLRGHWRDRLPAIDADVARMERALEGAPNRGAGAAAGAVDEAMGRPQRPWVPCGHEPPPAFQPGQAVELRLVVEGREPGQDPSGVQLRYRHVNQAEVWEAVEMERAGRAWQAAIPAAYTDSPYPLQYHFVLRRGGGRAWQFPGLGPELVQQPYFVVRQA
jgi:hypothetical protein